ncbi:MAG: hypothetical protein AAF485_32250, partial [Chloroflexota bacterium]
MAISTNGWLVISQIGIVIFTIALAWGTYQSHKLLKTFQPEFNLLLSRTESIMRIVLVGICLLLAWVSGVSAERLGFITPNFWRSIGLG